jgi:molecular chaperone DnaK
MGNVVGIDLGTTNSVAAFKLATVEVVTAPDNTPPERKLTRSIVAATNTGLVVGETAYRQLKAEPAKAISSIKRLMGRSFSDPSLKEQLSRFSYKVDKSTQGTENSLSIWLEDQEYSPEDISAAILKQVLTNAQNYQAQGGQTSKITAAVITIPAYFNDKQRYATQTAGKQAGLKTIELLPEPTAAAISYGFKPDSDDVETVLVYDFGGGTFDSSLITATGNQFIESGKAGDLWLGGDDIDTKLMELVKQKVAEQEQLGDIDGLIAAMPYYQQVRFNGDLKMAVERAKIDLSNEASVRVIPATPLLDDLGMAISIDIAITRAEFEQTILPLVERTIAICKDTIRYSDYPNEAIDKILMVGGSSQIPLVQAKVKDAFGEERVVVHPRPMYAVAEGAAIVAAGLTEKVSTVSRNYCIELSNESRFILVKQGEILPVTTTHTFRTEADGQRLIHFKFFSPDEVRTQLDAKQHDERIGEMWLVLNRSYARGTEIVLTVELDERNNSLQMTAALKNDPSVRANCSMSRGGIDERISREVEERIRVLNDELSLNQYGVERVHQLAGDIVKAANQIRDENGAPQIDRIEAAQAKLKELETFASKDLALARYTVNELELAAEYCFLLIHEVQLERMQEIITQLRGAIESNSTLELQQSTAKGDREIDNLPDAVKSVLFCRNAIERAELVSPTHGRTLWRKFGQMLEAIKSGDGETAEKILRELFDELEPYIDSEMPAGTIVTGLTR